jgi:hypothetical protein
MLDVLSIAPVETSISFVRAEQVGIHTYSYECWKFLHIDAEMIWSFYYKMYDGPSRAISDT